MWILKQITNYSKTVHSCTSFFTCINLYDDNEILFIFLAALVVLTVVRSLYQLVLIVIPLREVSVAGPEGTIRIAFYTPHVAN